MMETAASFVELTPIDDTSRVRTGFMEMSTSAQGAWVDRRGTSLLESYRRTYKGESPNRIGCDIHVSLGDNRTLARSHNSAATE
jgi:hypothetical protein